MLLSVKSSLYLDHSPRSRRKWKLWCCLHIYSLQSLCIYCTLSNRYLYEVSSSMHAVCFPTLLVCCLIYDTGYCNNFVLLCQVSKFLLINMHQKRNHGGVHQYMIKCQKTFISARSYCQLKLLMFDCNFEQLAVILLI